MTHQLLTVAIAVGEGCINEVQPQIEGALQSLERSLVFTAQPLLAADAPRAVANFADFQIGSAEFSISHLLHLTLSRSNARRLVELAVESWSVRVLLLFFVLSAWLAFGATFKLYLKDGDYHMVREYQVLDDRVRYFSTERGDWEEIPDRAGGSREDETGTGQD